MAEQQELAKVFSEVAFKAIGDLAESQAKKAATDEERAKWLDGGEYKIALHALVGGIMSDMGGSSFASGVASAGVNEAIQDQLSKITNPALHQWASALVGATAAKVAGGNTQSGASVAASGTKNNFLTHEQYAEYQAQLKDLKEKLKDGNINEEEYNAALREVTTYWTEKDIKQNKQWLADNHIEAVSIEGDFGQGVTQITLEKQQYQQMLIELSNSKNEEETASIKEKWRNASEEQINKWVEMGKELGYSPDGSKTSLFPTLSTEVVNLNNPYTAWVIESQTENALTWAKLSLKAQGIDPNNSSNALLLAKEVEKQLEVNKEIHDSIMGSIGGGGFKTFKELKAFLGSPGAGNQWHHIVEQAQQNASRAGFVAEEINTVENVIALQSGKASVHSAISGLYSSKPYWTGGLTVRDWLATKSFAEQFEFGMNALKDYGKVTRDSVGKWIFTPFD